MKKIIALCLTLVMLLSLSPVTGAATEAASTEETYEEFQALRDQLLDSDEQLQQAEKLTDEDYQSADDVFAQINRLEAAPEKKGRSQKQLTDAAEAIVLASDSYVEGSLERNGNAFTWWTEDGVRCIYSPSMREKHENMRAPENPQAGGVFNEPRPLRGGTSTSNQVYLIGPYYGYDDSFTNQYKNEAASISTAVGDSDGYTLYAGTSATVEKVADAVENGAVVIFDSHGLTDYDGDYKGRDPFGFEVYDYVTNANYSYLCLTSKEGLTTEDYNDGAAYFVDSDGLVCACINGDTIVNHMEKDSPGGFIWMAMCLGMATDTLCQPLRDNGVEVVYGYSQSISFASDYLFETTFWDNMIGGYTVSQSFSAMKSKWGGWDYSSQICNYYNWYGAYTSVDEARQYYASFPVIVSDEDAYPGQRNGSSFYGVCSRQTARSSYKLNKEAGSKPPKDSTISANMDKLISAIGNKSSTDEDGNKYWINNMQADGMTHFFVLTSIGDGVLFEYATTFGGEQPSVVLTSFLLTKDSTFLDVEMQLGLYSNDTIKNKITVTKKIDRSTLSKDSIFPVKESNYYFSSEDATMYFNTSMQLLCRYWDVRLYNELDLGLRYLGFDTYEGRMDKEPESTKPENTDPPEDVDIEITDPQVGVPYKLGIEHPIYGKTYYFDGTAFLSGGLSEFHSKAVNVYLEDTEGGYYVYFYDSTGAKKYIVHGIANYPTGTVPMFADSDNPSTVHTWNSQHNTLVSTMDGIDYFYGSYDRYRMLDACSMDTISTSYPSHFYSIEGRSPEDPDTTHNYDKLADYINQIGETDEEGNKFWMEYKEGERSIEFFGLTNTSDGIRFDYVITRPGSESTVSCSSFLMKRDSDDMPTEFWVGLHYYGICLEDITYNSSLDRSIFTTSTNCHIPLCCTFMTAEEATQLNTANIHSLCSFWDARLGETLDFGLRDLGFDIYDGFIPCPHTYDWDCDPDCNLCGRVRDASHNFSPWQKLDEASHSRVCDICEKEETAPHNWDAGKLTQLPTEDAPGILTYTCADCGATKTEEVDFIPGDIDGNGEVNRDDVVTLLLHVSMPDAFPLTIPADYNGDGLVTRDDVIQLLLHVSMPDAFPLQ